MDMLRQIICFSLLFITCYSLNAQEIHPYNKAIIWRGMEHEWTYNHRINRMGNYVSFDGENGYSLHSSATGLGSDSSYSRTYYTFVESPYLYFKEIVVTVSIKGKEGELLTTVNEQNVDLDQWMKGKDVYAALISGFEIMSLLKADQLQVFRCFVENPIIENQTGQLKLKTHLDLVTNCKSLECQVLNKQTAYEIKVPILIIAYDYNNAALTNTYNTISYDWDRSTEAEDIKKDIQINGRRNEFSEAFVGITGFGVVLNKQHWLLQHKSYIHPGTYDAQLGTMQSSINLRFLAWSKDMHDSKVAPLKSKLAKRKKGYVLLDMNTLMIQMKSGKTKSAVSESSLFWKGKNQKPTHFAMAKNILSDLSFDEN